MKYRAYFFINNYIHSAAVGIQAGHALDAMWSSYVEDYIHPKHAPTGTPLKFWEERFELLRTFSRDHKTWIVLQGGNQDEMTDLLVFLSDQYKYPISHFREPGLNNALTSVAIIIPDRLYDDVAKATGRAVQKSVDFGCGMNGWIDSPTLAHTIPCFPLQALHLEGPTSWCRNPSDPTIEDAIARNYTEWEMEFLMRKNLCKLAS